MLKKIISILILLILIISLFLDAFFISVQQEFVVIPNANAQEVNEFEKYLNMSLKDLHKEFDSELVNNGYPVEILDYIVKDGTYKELIEDYSYKYTEYLKGNADKPTIDENKANAILNKAVKEYNKDNNTNIVVDNEYVLNKIDNKANDIVEKVDNNVRVKSALRLIFSKKLQLLSLIVTLVSLIILLLINKLHCLNYIAFANLFDAVLVLVSYLIIKNSVIDELSNVFGDLYNSIVSTYRNFGIAYLVIGILLFVISIILFHKKKS